MNTSYKIAAAVLLMAASTASAHDEAKGANGGQVVDSKGHHLEFTAKDGAISIYLTDEKDHPIDSKGATGRVIIQDGATNTPVDLMPAEPNLLTAKTAAALTPGAKLVVSAKLSDGHDIQGRFIAK
jgi:hypothetical protein